MEFRHFLRRSPVNTAQVASWPVPPVMERLAIHILAGPNSAVIYKRSCTGRFRVLWRVKEKNVARRVISNQTQYKTKHFKKYTIQTSPSDARKIWEAYFVDVLFDGPSNCLRGVNVFLRDDREIADFISRVEM